MNIQSLGWRWSMEKGKFIIMGTDDKQLDRRMPAAWVVQGRVIQDEGGMH